MKNNHIPTYLNLMSEYVATLESMEAYPIPEQVMEKMRERCEQLKKISLEEIAIEHIVKELHLIKKSEAAKVEAMSLQAEKPLNLLVEDLCQNHGLDERVNTDIMQIVKLAFTKGVNEALGFQA